MVTVSTIGSSFDTLLAVYGGSPLLQLALIAADDDAGGNLTSRVAFEAITGVTCQVAVDGFDGASGSCQLHFTMP